MAAWMRQCVSFCKAYEQNKMVAACWQHQLIILISGNFPQADSSNINYHIPCLAISMGLRNCTAFSPTQAWVQLSPWDICPSKEAAVSDLKWWGVPWQGTPFVSKDGHSMQIRLSSTFVELIIMLCTINTGQSIFMWPSFKNWTM